MLQNRGFGIIGAVQQSTRPMRDNIGTGIQSVRRGIRQASGGLNLVDTARQIRENIAGQQTAMEAGPVRGAMRQAPSPMFSFQTREFVSPTGTRAAAPARPSVGRIVVDTGL